MSKESALKFLNTLGTNEKAKELLLQRKKPAGEEEKIKAYAEAAAGLGEPITAEDFREAVQYMQEQVLKQAEAAASGIQALEDDDVEDVAGGFYYYDQLSNSKEYKCYKDFTDTECWWEDACRQTIVKYFDCNGNFTTDFKW